ncbi:hypothetical protein V6N13_067763 [Hibiscus sabdariffa]
MDWLQKVRWAELTAAEQCHLKARRKQRYARFYDLCRISQNLQPEERRICSRICSFRGCWPACLTTCQFTWLLRYVVGSAGSSKKKQR